LRRTQTELYQSQTVNGQGSLKMSSGIIGPLAFSGRIRSGLFWLCYCKGLWVECDLVCGLEEVLTDGGHDHLRVCFCDPEVTGAV